MEGKTNPNSNKVSLSKAMQETSMAFPLIMQHVNIAEDFDIL